MSGFRFADGVEFLGDDGDGQVAFRVTMPIDEDGFFGRECPDCEQHFRIAHEDYDALPDEIRLWCVYCGHDDDHSEFLTKQQQDRLVRAAGDYAEQMFGRMLDRASRRQRVRALQLDPIFSAALLTAIAPDLESMASSAFKPMTAAMESIGLSMGPPVPDDPDIRHLVEFLDEIGEADRSEIERNFNQVREKLVGATWLTNLLTRATRQGWTVSNGTRSRPRWASTTLTTNLMTGRLAPRVRGL